MLSFSQAHTECGGLPSILSKKQKPGYLLRQPGYLYWLYAAILVNTLSQTVEAGKSEQPEKTRGFPRQASLS
jgi:hypothetical protein